MQRQRQQGKRTTFWLWLLSSILIQVEMQDTHTHAATHTHNLKHSHRLVKAPVINVHADARDLCIFLSSAEKYTVKRRIVCSKKS